MFRSHRMYLPSLEHDYQKSLCNGALFFVFPHSAADQVRIIRAPHIKGVRGCIDAAYTWPDTPVVGTGSAASNVTANDALVNGFLVLGRTLSSPVQVMWPRYTPTLALCEYLRS